MKHRRLPRILILSGVMLACSWGLGAAQTLTVKGRVTSSENHQGIAGVTVSVPGTDKGTVSDASGQYQLDGVAPTDSLAFSFVGFTKKVVAVAGRTEINQTLAPDISRLNQLVVVGYGTQKKKDLTGAISTINATQLQKEHPSTVQDVLRANVPGLQIGFKTTPKGDAGLQVRGKNTLNAGSGPLIVLDGVIYYGALSDINPNDIASVDVLKDASSAAVYGAKAAEGVIAITTKKGSSEKPTVNFNANIGVATREMKEPLYDPQQFIHWREDVQYSRNNATAEHYIFENPANLPSGVSMADWLAWDNSDPEADPTTVWLQRLNFRPIEIANYKAGRTVDWFDHVFQNGLRQDYTVSLSGRKQGLSYYWSLGYENNEGVVVWSKFSTYRSRLNLEADVTDFLTVGLNTQFAARDESAVPADWDAAVRDSPFGSFYTDDSSDYRYSPQDEPGGGSRNPLAAAAYTDRIKRFYTLNSSMYAKVKLPFHITYQVNFTPRLEWYNYFNHQSSKYQDWAGAGGNSTREHHVLYQWQVDNVLNWNQTFGDHHFEVTLLANAEKYQIWRDQMTNSGFLPNDNLGYNNIGAGTNPAMTSGPGDYSDASGTYGDEYSTGDALMARLFYSFMDRYLVTLSFRRDGYSAFGQRNPRANFPSAALGWVFTQEPFFSADWLNYGKLRLSYGINGNRDVGRYVALANLQTGKYLHVSPDGGTVTTPSQLYVNNMPNPDLKWEQTTALNAGLDFSLMDGVLDGSIDAYRSKTTNLLVKRILPNVTGFDFVWSNLGEVDNHGLEIDLKSRNMQRPNFSWRTAFNFSLNRNKIAHLYGNMVDVTDDQGKVIGQKEADDISNKWFIGHPIDAVWNIKVLGVYQSDQQDAAARYGQYPGDFHLQDVDDDGKYTNADRQFLGFSEPRFRWTLRNEFTIMQHFDLSFLLYSLWGHMGTYNIAKNRDGFPDRSNSYQIPYWTADNPTNDYARLYSSDGGASFDVYRKRSFVRLDNVSLAYTFPQHLLDKASIQALRVYFTVKNAALYAPDWDFWDPENGALGNDGPASRIYTLGVNLTL